MPEETLGSGLYLDTQLDFDPNETGDLRSTSGSDELQKDLAFQLLITLDEYIGPPLTPGIRADIKSRTIDTIESDVRVDTVDRGAMTVVKPKPNAIQIEARVIAGDEEQEFIFNL